MKSTGKYSIGLGDRFGHQAETQLRAVIYASEKGIELTPVWNKSNREHIITGTSQASLRHEADAAVKKNRLYQIFFCGCRSCKC